MLFLIPLTLFVVTRVDADLDERFTSASVHHEWLRRFAGGQALSPLGVVDPDGAVHDTDQEPRFDNIVTASELAFSRAVDPTDDEVSDDESTASRASQRSEVEGGAIADPIDTTDAQADPPITVDPAPIDVDCDSDESGTDDQYIRPGPPMGGTRSGRTTHRPNRWAVYSHLPR